MIELLHLFLMFITAFGAATLLPFGSEPLFIGYLVAGNPPALLLFIAACLGNILGGIVNYWCGLKIKQGNAKFKIISDKHLEKAETLFNQYGGYTLLFSWVFIIGDPLTVMAGVAHYDFKKFLILMSIGKIFRFVFLWASVVGFNYFFQ